ncbi:MAG: glutaredoxin family protein [Terriglobales bacterium]
MAERHEVVLYTRKECHLCEVVKESLERLRERAEFCLRVVDIDADEETRRLYNEEVPVVFINGRKAFKYRMDEQEFLRKLGR